MDQFTIPNSVPVCQLECGVAFEGLQQKEKLYAHYLSNACYQGGLIVLLQTSPESPGIFMLLQRLFSEERLEALKSKTVVPDGNITDNDFQALLTYAAGFYSNMGNYKSFGDTKIVPAIAQEKFKAVVWQSEAYKKNTKLIEQLWVGCSGAMYNLDQRRKELGLGKKGLSTYYSSNITEEDVNFVQEFMQEKKLSPYNTRLFKVAQKDKTVSYQLRLASAAGAEKAGEDDDVHQHLGCSTFKDFKVEVTRGDYSELLQRTVTYLNKAKEYAANENEVQMIEYYIKAFTFGSINAHKDGSRYWIKNKGPVIETYIGFIESYRDPYGVRGEFEGFVAMVNKAMSAKFGILVENAEELLKLLPWPSEYEKDTFLRPDFTSLDVLTFAGSGIPAGINIPNYDDIRQNEGFKNVSLGNVLQSHSTDQIVTFLNKENQELYSKYKAPSFEVQVGLHELLGHGSGKLFQKNQDGTFNFDVDQVKHLETNEKITSWYNPGETWDTVFSAMGSSYEECRAECVGIYLCLDEGILRTFGHEGDEAKKITYINWLNMVRAGLLGLEFYSPETKEWKQAHMNARFVILQVLMEAGNEFVTIQRTTGEDGKPDLRIVLIEDQIKTTGKNAIAEFLKKLQLYKATADVNKGQELYKKYSTVNEDMLAMRETVLSRKQPRRMFVQANTEIIGDEVKLTQYPGNVSSLIESFTKRFPKHDNDLEKLWNAESSFHKY
ncbi:dipeptidyl peptidase 3-like isoform X2 [Hydractinia symbiolongicarpus]|uniref:dipeptidyl peptidase 3-like isoform X2 n=1 Tax=Hydractinia symbiolongicarpus TaxID=13093 RepID=UPI00254E5336|nr:dipeptidyl peptidase 3-like isoform X2 [Hydractinia symbiolongicarpus]